VRILITGSHQPLARALSAAWVPQHEIRTLDLTESGAGRRPDVVGDPRDRDLAARATAGCDAIVHVGALAPPGAAEGEVLDAATRGTYNLITTAPAGVRFILLSTLRLFEAYPPRYRVTEQWAPRPTPAVADLAPYLAELTVREVSRVLPLTAVALRLGEVVDDQTVAERAPDPRWLHRDDAVAGIDRALAFTPPTDGPSSGWWVFHLPGAGSRTRFPIGMAGQAPFGYAPVHAFGGPVTEVTVPPVSFRDRIGGAARRVVIFGAGGPLAAVTATALAPDHQLRLTDVRPLAEIVAEGKPQSPGAPMPQVLGPPHEERVVDVTDADPVMEAARGMDAIINCTVVRPHPVLAFRVNTVGAYQVMRAAVAAGIRRVVHTGPQQITLPYPAGYAYDFGVPDDVPSRPGANLYILTKFLGQEICRIFAEAHDLEVPTLLFSSFVNPANPAPEPLGAYPFSVSWEDAGQAMRQALRAPSFPRPFEVLHILGDLPHGKYRNEKAKHLLQWQPRDRLEAHWQREWGEG
jgi:nucleoside-diphosphate-sugar epimerase